MPNFHRYYIPNAIIFITAVTYNRNPYIQSDGDLETYWETLRSVQQIHPFRLLAYVILPDHFHWLMRADDSEGNFSTVLHSLKRNYTINYKQAHNISSPMKIWQSRYWDHIIRNERDLNQHFDYIHWNPVKHGFVPRPENWQQSSYSHWYGKGFYTQGWVWEAGIDGDDGDSFGE